jgi:hypothetical protein
MTRVRFACEPPPAGAAERAADSAPPRRIWEVDVGALKVVLAALLGREGLSAVLARLDLERPRVEREEALLVDVALRCQRRCALAEEVERQLDLRTSNLRHFTARCPLGVLATWWAEAERCEEAERSALLWSLATDPRLDLDGSGAAR